LFLYFRTVNIYLAVSFPKVLDALFQRILTQSNFSPRYLISVVVGRKTDGSKESLIDGSTLIPPETNF